MVHGVGVAMGFLTSVRAGGDRGVGRRTLSAARSPVRAAIVTRVGGFGDLHAVPERAPTRTHARSGQYRPEHHDLPSGEKKNVKSKKDTAVRPMSAVAGREEPLTAMSREQVNAGVALSGGYTRSIGNTPMVELKSLSPNPLVKIYLKCEFMNPGYSIKDRIAEHILNKAEASGKLKPGGTVVAASSGNTAAAFAMLCAARNYKAVVITNTKCSKEKIDAMRAYGAETIVTRSGVPPDHPEHYQNVEDRLVEENPGWLGVNQYDNPLNPEAYYNTLAPEIWDQTAGQVTHFFAAASTGGTVSGIGKYLKERNPDIQVVCPDPVGSIFYEFYTKGTTDNGKSFQVEGVGKDSLPANMNFQVIDKMLPVHDVDAFKMCRRLSENEGLVCGGSTGLNVHAAVEYARTLTEPATIVCIAPDSGIKYLSKIFNDEWLSENGMASAGGSACAEKASTAKAKGLSFMNSLSPKLIEYMDGLDNRDASVVELATPEEISAAFSGGPTSLSLDAVQEPIDSQALLSCADIIMKYSVRTGSPLFNNQLYGPADSIGVAGEWLTAALNTNVHTYEVAPVFTLMEREVLRKIAVTVGGAYAEESDGLFVPGGSIASMYGMILARHKICPETRTRGNAAVASKGLVAFTSAEAHYSYLKASMVMGLGTDNLVKVACDPITGAMLPEALEEAIEAKKAEGYTPFFVGATAGTTVLGAFDPFPAVHSVCEKHGLWMHVDAAWGGGAMFSAQKKTQALCEGVYLADSLTYNPHKMMGAPLQCSTFVTRHLGALEAANAANAAYLFQPDKNFTELDTGDKTIQCGRHADSLKLWLMWKALGDKGLSARVDHCIWLAEYMSKRIAKQLDQNGNRCFVQVAPTQYSNLCFYLIPPSLRSPEFNGIDAATPEQLERLSKVSPIVKDRMQRAGKAMIGFQPVNGFNNCFRMVIAGAKENLCTDGIDSILGSMLALSTDL